MKKTILYLIITLFTIQIVSAALTDNLLTVYNFESDNTSLVDVFNGNSNSTNINGNYLALQPGIVGNSWKMSNQSPHNMTAAISDFPIGNSDRTIKVWVKNYTGMYDNGKIWSYGTSEYDGIYTAGADRDFYTLVAGQDINPATYAFSPTSGWEMVTWMYIGATKNVSIWRNNTIIVSKVLTNPANTALTSFIFGHQSGLGGTAGKPDGVFLDEMGVWNRTLTQAEMTAIWGNESIGVGYSNNTWTPTIVTITAIGITNPTNNTFHYNLPIHLGTCNASATTTINASAYINNVFAGSNTTTAQDYAYSINPTYGFLNGTIYDSYVNCTTGSSIVKSNTISWLKAGSYGTCTGSTTVNFGNGCAMSLPAGASIWC